MKIKLSKKQKKWALVLIVAVVGFYVYKRFYSVKINDNPLGKLGSGVIQNVRSYVDKGRKYITLLGLPSMDWDAYFTELAGLGYDGVFSNVRYADIVKPNGTYDFSRYDKFFQIATSKGLEFFPNISLKMGVGERGQYNFPASERWLNADGSLYGAGSVSARYDSVLWATHFQPFVTAFCERYKVYYTAGWMLGVSFANTIQEEFNFNHDYEALGVTTYKQKHELLQACFDGLTSAAGDIPTCFHSGEFQTEIAKRVGTFGFRRLAQKAKWTKQNPNKHMDIDYVARVSASTGKGSIIELTYTEGQTEYELSTQAGRCFALGVDIVTFAFVEDAVGLPKVRAIKNQMVEKGAWVANKGSLPAHTYTVNVSDMLSNGGYFLSAFKAAYVGGVPPQVNQVYNL